MLKNITFSAEEDLIQEACEKADREHTTINEYFRQWLKQYVHQNSETIDYENVMQELTYVEPGGKFSREELNER